MNDSTESVFEIATDTPPTTSLLDALKQELQKPLQHEQVTLRVPGRPTYSVTYDARVGWDDQKRWSSASSNDDGFDEIKANAMMLSERCISINIDGIGPVRDTTGELVTFRSKEFIQSTGELNPRNAIAKFFVNDADLFAHAGELMKRSGWGGKLGDNLELDPTATSID